MLNLMGKLIKIFIYTWVLFIHATVVYSAQSPVVSAKGWGKPKFSVYTSINTTQQWLYSREFATLIVSRAECKQCKPVSKQNVKEYNQNGNTALFMIHDSTPALFRLYASPKGVNLRVFQIFKNNYYYKVQLGINQSLLSKESFKLEQEFMELINNTKF